MSTHKHFDRICFVVIAFTLIITVLFVNAESFGIQKASGYMKYEYTLFLYRVRVSKDTFINI